MWQYISMCFVRYWNNKSVAVYLTKSLSKYKGDGCSKGTLNLEEDKLAIKFHIPHQLKIRSFNNI